MFEVVPAERLGWWRWQMISATGRTLVQSSASFACSLVAARDAIAWRKAFFSHAERVDCDQYEGGRACHG